MAHSPRKRRRGKPEHYSWHRSSLCVAYALLNLRHEGYDSISYVGLGRLVGVERSTSLTRIVEKAKRDGVLLAVEPYGSHRKARMGLTPYADETMRRVWT